MANLTPRTVKKKEFYKEHFYKHPISLQKTVARARAKKQTQSQNSQDGTPRTPKLTLDDFGIPIQALPDLEHSVTLRRLTDAEHTNHLKDVFIKGFKYGYMFQCGLYAMNLFFAQKPKSAQPQPNILSKILNVFLTKQHFVLGTVFGITRIINTFTLKSKFCEMEDIKTQKIHRKITYDQILRCIGCGLLSGLCFKGMDGETRNWISLNILVYAGYDYYRLVIRSPIPTSQFTQTDDTNSNTIQEARSENDRNDMKEKEGNDNDLNEDSNDEYDDTTDDFSSDLGNLVSDEDWDVTDDDSTNAGAAAGASPLLRKKSSKTKSLRRLKSKEKSKKAVSGNDEKLDTMSNENQNEKNENNEKNEKNEKSEKKLNKMKSQKEKENILKRVLIWADERSARILLGVIFGTIAFGLFKKPYLLDKGYYKTAIKWSDLTDKQITTIFREPSLEIPPRYVDCCPNLHFDKSCLKSHTFNLLNDIKSFRYFKMYATVHFGSLLFNVKFYKLLLNLLQKYLNMIKNLFGFFDSRKYESENEKRKKTKKDGKANAGIPRTIDEEKEEEDDNNSNNNNNNESSKLIVEPPAAKSIEFRLFNIIKNKFIATVRSMLFLIFNTRLSALLMCWLRWLIQHKFGLLKNKFGIIAGISSAIGGIIASLFETRNRAISYNIYCIIHVFKMIGRAIHNKHLSTFNMLNMKYNFDIDEWWSIFVFGFSFILWDFSRLMIESKKKPIWYARWSCIRGFKDERLKSWMLQYFL